MKLLDQLQKEGFTVVTFDGYQHRVNGEFDFWLNDKGRGIAWHDRVIGDRGRRPKAEILNLVIERLRYRPPEAPKEVFISRLVETGWKKEEAEKQWNDRNSAAKS